MIFVIATIELKAGRRDAFLTEFRQLVPQVLRETGCVEYGPAIDVDTSLSAQTCARPDVVTVIEKWESIECLETHLMAAHMLAYRERVKPLVKGVVLQILQPA